MQGRMPYVSSPSSLLNASSRSECREEIGIKIEPVIVDCFRLGRSLIYFKGNVHLKVLAQPEDLYTQDVGPRPRYDTLHGVVNARQVGEDVGLQCRQAVGCERVLKTLWRRAVAWSKTLGIRRGRCRASIPGSTGGTNGWSSTLPVCPPRPEGLSRSRSDA